MVKTEQITRKYFLAQNIQTKKIKTLTSILAFLIGQITFAQNLNANPKNDNGFYFYYSVAGMGSNIGSLQPTLEVYSNKFIYTRQQNSYWGKRNEKSEFISNGVLRQSSIDSILFIIQDLKDTTVYKVNPCIMSGSITLLNIRHGVYITKFTLHNTFDIRAIKILNIINSYLPKDKKLYASEEDIREEEDCWMHLFNRANSKKDKDSSNSK